jgi:hypothetical protein
MVFSLLLTLLSEKEAEGSCEGLEKKLEPTQIETRHTRRDDVKRKSLGRERATKEAHNRKRILRELGIINLRCVLPNLEQIFRWDNRNSPYYVPEDELHQLHDVYFNLTIYLITCSGCSRERIPLTFWPSIFSSPSWPDLRKSMPSILATTTYQTLLVPLVGSRPVQRLSREEIRARVWA